MQNVHSYLTTTYLSVFTLAALLSSASAQLQNGPREGDLDSSAGASEIYVPHDFASIREAIEAAENGDQIVVSPGRYLESQLNLLGKAITVRSQVPAKLASVANTIVDGNGVGPVFVVDAGETSNTVIAGLTITGGVASRGGGVLIENSSPTIFNCWIDQNRSNDLNGGGGGLCIANGSPFISWGQIRQNHASKRGGGVWIVGESYPVFDQVEISENRSATAPGAGVHCMASAAFLECQIERNDANTTGGGIFAQGANLLFQGGQISDNEASFGGGGYFVDCHVIIRELEIRNNFCFNYGGGLAFLNSLTSIDLCTIDNNMVFNPLPGGAAHGGGVYANGSILEVRNTLLANNQAIEPVGIGSGGGMKIVESTLEMTNSTVADNHTTGLGGGLSAEEIAYGWLTNSIVWGNTPNAVQVFEFNCLKIDYSIVEGGWHGTGCLNVDPLFREPASGDYHLSAIQCGGEEDSPAIDSGNPSMTDWILNCNWGLGTNVADLGAYGGRGIATSNFESSHSNRTNEKRQSQQGCRQK